MKIDYIIPTLYRPTLSRTIASIQKENVNHNLLIYGTKESAGYNRNEGLNKVVDSDWIVFVDDDDYLITGHSKELDKDFDIVVLRMKQDEKIIPNRENNVLQAGNMGINFAVNTSFYNKNRVVFDNEGHEEDWRFFIKLCEKTDKIKVTDKIYYIAPKTHHIKEKQTK
jgi:glycosyltransferase involved in cell wall biosynthesis|tara:strand:- start:858 stop:1361 length:504 start_codon:yes stop_codon:yes gene_type:complete